MPKTFSPRRTAAAGNLERLVDRVDLVVIFVANVDVAVFRAEEKCCDDHPFDDHVGRAQQELAVLEGRRLAFVGVADDIFLVAPGLHDVAPFLRGRSACAPHAAEVGLFQLGDHALAYGHTIRFTGGGLELLGDCSRQNRAAPGHRRRRLPADRDRSAKATGCGRPGQAGISRPSRWAVIIVRSRARKSPAAGCWRMRTCSGWPASCSSTSTAGAPSHRPRQETLSTLTRESSPKSLATVLSPARRPGAPRKWQAMSRQTRTSTTGGGFTPKVREEADDFVNPMQGDVEPVGEPLELLVRQIADTLLDRT